MRAEVLLLLLLPLALAAGCREKEKAANFPPELLGRWKLKAFVNIAEGSKKAPESDCDSCYTPTFKDHGTFTAFTQFVGISGTYQLNGVSIALGDFSQMILGR